MEDGDLVASTAVLPRNASPGAAAVAAPRSATPDAPAATSGATPDAGSEAVVFDEQAPFAASSSASDRRGAIVLRNAHAARTSYARGWGVCTTLHKRFGVAYWDQFADTFITVAGLGTRIELRCPVQGGN